MDNCFLLHTEDRVKKPFIDINSFRRNHNFYAIDISNRKDIFAAQITIVVFLKRQMLMFLHETV